MKITTRFIRVPAFLLLLMAFNLPLPTAFAQGTAFTYQGRLNDGVNSATGSYDFTFALFATNTGGVPIAGPLTNGATAVSNGLFTATVDFGASAFTGGSNWLEIAVSTNGANAFSTLTPRQEVTPTPYAIVAESANIVPGFTVQQNASGAPDVVDGAPVNYAGSGVVGATIAGGGATNFPIVGRFGTTYYSYTNSVTGNFGTVGGGGRNTAGAEYATVSGGDNNTASGINATVGGGAGNTASGQDATVGGGSENTASGNYSTVPGGQQNLASGLYSFAAGVNAQATNTGSFVWSDSSLFQSTTNYQFSVKARGGIHLVGNVGIGTAVPGDELSIKGGALSFHSVNNDVPYVGMDYDPASDALRIRGNIASTALNTNYVTIVRTNGFVGIGTTNPADNLDVAGYAWMEGGLYVGNGSLENGYLQVNGNGYIEEGLTVNCYNNNVVWVGGNLEVAGNAYKTGGGSWGSLSDERLKKNIRPLTGVLDKLLELQGVSFEFKDPEKIHELSGERIGMIAQQVEKVFPDWVSTGKDGYKRLTYRGFEALTVEALRELRAEKDAKIAALEKQDAEMERELAEQKNANAKLAARFDQLEKTVARISEKSNPTLAINSKATKNK